jgi:hypothetical protein
MSIITTATRTGNKSELICDKCKVIIAVASGVGVDETERKLPSQKYRDQNWGHECERCRKSRERDYDRYVMNRGEQS